MSGTRLSVQQQDNVAELQAASLQVSLHVLDQRGPNIHRLVRVQPERRLLLSPHDLHNQWRGQTFKLLRHDHLVEVRFLHHKVKAMFLQGEINCEHEENNRWLFY